MRAEKAHLLSSRSSIRATVRRIPEWDDRNPIGWRGDGEYMIFAPLASSNVTWSIVHDRSASICIDLRSPCTVAGEGPFNAYDEGCFTDHSKFVR